MARLRLFAGLRDAAGTGSVEIDASTVGEVLDAASDRFGPGFSAAAERARVWVNGDEAEAGSPVGPDDEVALIPPVSGGAGTLVDVPAGGEWLVAVGLGLVLIFVNAMTGDVWWPVAVVGVISAWAGDVIATAAHRGRDFPLVPTLLAVLAAVASTRLLGADGLGIAYAAAVVFPLAWSVASDESRVLQSLAPSMVVSLSATAAACSLLLAREAFAPATRATGVLLAVAVAATAIGAVIERFSHLPFGDPYTSTALAAILTSLVTASIWDLSLVTFLVMGVVMAAAFVAGSALGSLLRTGTVALVSRPPGFLAGLDGVVLAAAVFLPVLRVVA